MARMSAAIRAAVSFDLSVPAHLIALIYGSALLE
ncbi:unnamed protein product [Strongylus vulgaris]|uniref:Uncharacterized protein n=1 Tax=Strongylus vulgaris TaxID=40348 RepID=A0A3P7K7U9_STRVU|nr:unnamed protein product [Strongylus vulgaris]